MAPTASFALPARRCIYNDVDLQEFMDSATKRSLMHFTETLGNACLRAHHPRTAGYSYDPAYPLTGLSPGMACLHGVLEGLERWVQEDNDESSTPYRFGNPRFRTVWHARLSQRSAAIVTAILRAADDAASLEAARQVGWTATQSDAATVWVEKAKKNENVASEIITELSLYLHDAFGHPVRLDYGTGHETSFHIFLYALSQLHVMGQPPLAMECCQAVALSIYHQYLRVTRALQTRYQLEPAGSHGVWGLDDFHCLPFYFGACQLAATESPAASDDDDDGSPQYTPQSIHDASVLASPAADTYLYFSCIRFICSIKKNVPFFESSPMLNDISHLPSWSKVAKGLLKLYDGEVLRQRPVVQHLLFGTLFPCTWTPSAPPPAAPTAVFRHPPAGMEATRAPWAPK
jgi:Phosphotyrosyl phosphate activator (PTPA) protein